MRFMSLCLPVVFPAAAGGVNRPRWLQHARLAGAHMQTDRQTDGRTDRQWSCHFPCALLGGEFAPTSRGSSYFESDPSFRQRPCSCQEPWLKMTDSVVVEGYARLRDGKKVFSLTLICRRKWQKYLSALSSVLKKSLSQLFGFFHSGKLGGSFFASRPL